MTISLPRELLDRIDAYAADDHRSRSQWLVLELEKLFQQDEQQDEQQLPSGLRSVKSPRVAALKAK